MIDISTSYGAKVQLIPPRLLTINMYCYSSTDINIVLEQTDIVEGFYKEIFIIIMSTPWLSVAYFEAMIRKLINNVI